MSDPVPRVTGIGGVFFRSADPAATAAWYARHLGFDVTGWGGAIFTWTATEPPGKTVWAPFAADTGYFGDPAQPFMLNLRVADLDRLLADLAAEGVTVIEERYADDNGRFGWILDGDGRKVELWEPPSR